MLIRRWLPVLFLTLAALACQAVQGGGPGAAPYLGAFDCYGTEGGLGAYAGRVTLNADGTAIFRNYDDQTQTGSWSHDPSTSTVSFTGTIDVGLAVYDASADTMVVHLASGAQVVHAEGDLHAERAGEDADQRELERVAQGDGALALSLHAQHGAVVQMVGGKDARSQGHGHRAQ